MRVFFLPYSDRLFRLFINKHPPSTRITRVHVYFIYIVIVILIYIYSTTLSLACLLISLLLTCLLCIHYIHSDTLNTANTMFFFRFAHARLRSILHYIITLYPHYIAPHYICSCHLLPCLQPFLTTLFIYIVLACYLLP